MKECEHRQSVTTTPDSTGRVSLLFIPSNEQQAQGFRDAAATGLKQDFSNGTCDYLTAIDFGPIACNHPNNNFENCPDEDVIALKKEG